MNLYFCIVGHILIFLVSWRLAKDLLHPAVLFPIPWIVFLLFLSFSNFNYNSESDAYLYFLIGTMMFSIGCFFGHKRIRRGERLSSVGQMVLYSDFFILKIILIIESFFTIFLLISYASIIVNYWNANIFTSIYTNRSEISHVGLIGYGRNIFTGIGLAILIGYVHLDNEDKSRYRKYLIISTVLYLILSITRITRNGILFAVIPLIFAFIVVAKQNNIKIMGTAIVAAVIIIMVFSYIAISKYYRLFENADVFSTLMDQFAFYGSGSFVAFQQRFDINNFGGSNGANTFRFILAIYDSLAGTHYAPEITQEFSTVAQGYYSNVYTFYQWYADDFGLIYALLIQFIIGILHGHLYKKMAQKNMFGILAYSFLMYPLLMQFFQDQYLSVVVNWLVVLISGGIILNTNILFSREIITRELKKTVIKIYI